MITRGQTAQLDDLSQDIEPPGQMTFDSSTRERLRFFLLELK